MLAPPQRHPYGPNGSQSVDNAFANGARPPGGGGNSSPITMFSVRPHPKLKLKIPAWVFCVRLCADFESRGTQGDQLPVKRAIVRNFGTFNRLFSATPVPTAPST